MMQQADSANADPHSCDILIVGGAMVGGTLALALARQGYRVMLVDTRPINDAELSADLIDRRTTAVAAATSHILDAFGIWPEVEQNCCAIRAVHVSQRGSFGVLTMRAEEYDMQALGFVLDNGQYNAHIANCFASQPGLSVIAPAELVSYSQDRDTVTVKLQSRVANRPITRNLSARLLIGADGANSAVRSQLGIAVSETDYQQYAVLTSVETELPNQQVAYERFTQSGPLALLPMASHISSVVYTVDAEQIESLRSLAVAEQQQILREQIQTQFGYRLGQIRRCAKADFFPLILRSAAQVYSGRTLLLGNALRTLHPVAGQGFNLAVRDMGKLLELLVSGGKVNDPGASSLLKQFATQRAADQSITMTATDTLAKVFRGNNQVFSHLRALGLISLDAIPPLKRSFAWRAMGFGVPLPDLHYPR